MYILCIYTGKTTHDDSLYNDKKTHQQQALS